MSVYKVQPASGEPEYTVEADHLVYDPNTGRHLLYITAGDSDELVASLINVSVSKQPDA